MLTLAVKLSKNSLDLLKAVENQDKISTRIDEFQHMLNITANNGRVYYICVDFTVAYRVDSILEIDTVYLLDETEFNEAWRFVNNREHHLSAVYPK